MATSSEETSPPEDEYLGDSPPPSAKSSPSPPPPSKSAPPPPESSPPPPVVATPPPSKPKDSNPPPEATPPPPSPSPSPPPPPAPSKAESAAPPPPEKADNPPPKDSNPPPTQTQSTPTPSPPPPPADPRSPPSPPRPPSEKSSPVGSPHIPFEASPPSFRSLPPTHLTPHAAKSPTPLPAPSANGSVVMILGISVGGMLILSVIIACVLCSRRKKKGAYYYDKERPSQDQFYNGTTEWTNQHSMEQGVKIASPSGVMGTPGQWGGVPSIQPARYSHEYFSASGQQNAPSPITPMGGLGHSQSQFSYEDLAVATAGFSPANLIGQGGFGYVHKGVLPDGKVVAVKSLKSGSGQGEREFQAEVEIISRVHHRHLVSLVGYCIADGQRMLVYEFVPNSTMEHHLHGKGQPVMDWTSRMRIAIGSAKGLAYLHEDCHPRIIHRDIKAANILLDENYEAMVADFGLAKLTTENVTHVSTRVMGTFGYLAPEYASSGKLSEKSDVFSFGVMLLELITGRKPVGGQVMEDSLVDWARPLLQQALEDGNYDELADPKLDGNYEPNEMVSMISCASASIRHSAKRRPKMSQIVRALEGDSTLVEETGDGSKKTARNKSNIASASGSASTHDPSYDTMAYNADMMKFRQMVMMNSQEFGASSDFGTTSEYGLNQSTSSSSNNSKEFVVHSGSLKH